MNIILHETKLKNIQVMKSCKINKHRRKKIRKTYIGLHMHARTSSAVNWTKLILLRNPSNKALNWTGRSWRSLREFALWTCVGKLILLRTCSAYGWMGVKSNRAVSPSHEKWSTWQSLRNKINRITLCYVMQYRKM